jgi:hypothetical protein
VGGSPRGALAAWRRDGAAHPSPNAGPVEAAAAGALGVTLGGRTVYPHGVEERPRLGEGPPPGPADLARAARLSRLVGAAAAVLSAALAVLFRRTARSSDRYRRTRRSSEGFVRRGRARHAMEELRAPFVVHCDVDVLSFADTPLADVPDSGGGPIGLRLHKLAASLAGFAASPRFAGLVLTEINPDHAPDAGVLENFVAVIADALDRRAVER